MGYHGSQAFQLWQYDLADKQFTCLNQDEWGAAWPLWRPDGVGCEACHGAADRWTTPI